MQNISYETILCVCVVWLLLKNEPKISLRDEKCMFYV